MVLVAFDGGGFGDGVVHSERFEDALPHEHGEPLVCGGFNGSTHANPVVGRIAVLGPQLEDQRTVREARAASAGCLQCFEEQRAVTAVADNAGSVGHHLAQRDRHCFLGTAGTQAWICSFSSRRPSCRSRPAAAEVSTGDAVPIRNRRTGVTSAPLLMSA